MKKGELNIKDKQYKSKGYRVLFVCNGNVFRSFSAEVLLKHYLDEHKIKGLEIFSAGTIAKKEKIDLEIIYELKKFGVKHFCHIPHKLNKSMLKKSDLVIAMAEDQISFMKNEFNYIDAVLFNEVANNKKTSIWDIDKVKNYLINRDGVEKKIDNTIQYIHDNIPRLFEGIIKYFQNKF